MDLADIHARALAARESVKVIDGRSFTVRAPTKHETAVAAYRAGVSTGDDLSAMLRLQRALLEHALVGWSAVVVGDVLPGDAAAAETLPYSPGAVPLLLDAQDDWAKQLGKELTNRLAARNAPIEADTKN